MLLPYHRYDQAARNNSSVHSLSEFLAYLFVLELVVFDTEFLLQFFNGIVRIRQWAMQMYAAFKIRTKVAVLT